jgi:hypothetical protein
MIQKSMLERSGNIAIVLDRGSGNVKNCEFDGFFHLLYF